MKLFELFEEANPHADTPKLVQVLRTVIGDADQKGVSVFLHFSKPTANDIRSDSKNLDLNKLMQNVGAEQFDYGTFKAAYDTDERLKSLVQNFSEKGIEPATKEQSTDTPQGDTADSNAVAKMAKSATDIGDKL
jgi:hypothetical protein|tara:strand:- start:1064 stop:1465 length:402 start_codon:yes stop_codon:yes gene_type:complete